MSPFTAFLPASADLDRHDCHLAKHAGDGQQRFKWDDAVEARFDELDVDRVDFGLVVGRVDGHPAAVDVDFVPEMEAETRRDIGVDQANDACSCRHSLCADMAAVRTPCSVKSPEGAPATIDESDVPGVRPLRPVFLLPALPGYNPGRREPPCKISGYPATPSPRSVPGQGLAFPGQGAGLPAYRELVDAGIMEPDGGAIIASPRRAWSIGKRSWKGRRTGSRRAVRAAGCERPLRGRKETAGMRPGPCPEGDESNRPAYRELVKRGS